MSETHRTKRLVHILKEMAENPDIHPVFRGEAKTAAETIEQLAADIDALHRHGSDHS